MADAKEVQGENVARGVLWRVMEVAGTEVLAFGSFVLLARLLAPDDFGLVSQASLFILTVQLVLQQGFPEALVQMEAVDDAHFETSLWANTGLGAVTAIALALAAPLVSLALAEPALTAVLLGLAPTLVLLGANRIYLARLRRSLRFQDFMLVNVIATLGGAAGAVTLATGGFGLWALVAQQWLYASVGLVVGFIRTGWLPGLRFDKARLQAMWAFSSFTVLEALSAFCARRLDLLILAWFWSSREVGFYFLANRLLFSAGMLTYYSISHLGLPFLARLQGDPLAYREAIYRTMQLVSLACMPTLVGLALVAPSMIPLLFGSEWASSIRPFQALAAFSVFYSMTLISGQVLIAAGHAKDAMVLAGASMAVFLIAVTFAAPHGIDHAAIAGGLASLLILPIYLWRLKHHFGIRLGRWLAEQLPCFTATNSMIAAVWCLDLWPGLTAHPALHLVAACLTGAVTFVTVMVLLARQDLLDIRASCWGGKERDREARA